jgi:hypothetical protein
MLSGYKTYIAAVIAALVAVNGVMHLVPDNIAQALLGVAASLGLYGLRSAIANLESDEK